MQVFTVIFVGQKSPSNITANQSIVGLPKYLSTNKDVLLIIKDF